MQQEKDRLLFASCDVMPDIEEDLDVEINDDDIRIDTYRSSINCDSTLTKHHRRKNNT